jgi:SAM-dependent methyltransferase
MARSFPPAVSEERWSEAQQWERAFWNRQNVPPPWWKRLLRPLLVLVGLRPPKEEIAYDDRNVWWKQQFDGYAMLPWRIDALCELGCGPYTNTRLIIEGREVGSIVCSDPLAATYVTYENAWLARAYREKRITIDTNPCEVCPLPSDAFDVVVMINVLDHVRDPKRCLEQAMRITKPGGLFVFGQDLTSEEDEQPGNPGHPFTVHHEQVLPVLGSAFDQVFLKMVPREELDEPAMHYGAMCYVGRKR